jgi:hypothetical protein
MKFKLVLDSHGAIATQWVNAPYVVVVPPAECIIATAGIAVAVSGVADLLAPISVAKDVENDVASLNTSCGQLGCAGLLRSLTHTDQGIEIEVDRAMYHTVTVRVPYARLSPVAPSDLTSYGLALPLDQPVLIVSGGLATACYGTSGACAPTRSFGAAGLFNAQGKTLIPSPWPSCDTPPCPVYVGRIGPWDRQLGLSRGIGDFGVDGRPRLPFSLTNVGAVIGEEAFASDAGLVVHPFVAGSPCQLPVDATQSLRRVSFGRNDWALTGPYGGQFGTGDGRVTVMLGGLGYLATECPDRSP